jgi:hypothetical protein
MPSAWKTLALCKTFSSTRCGVIPFSLECDYLLENVSTVCQWCVVIFFSAQSHGCFSCSLFESFVGFTLRPRASSVHLRSSFAGTVWFSCIKRESTASKTFIASKRRHFQPFSHLNLDALLNALHFLAPSSCRLEGIVSSDRAPRRVARNSVNYRLCLQVDNEKRFTRNRNG